MHVSGKEGSKSYATWWFEMPNTSLMRWVLRVCQIWTELIFKLLNLEKKQNKPKQKTPFSFPAAVSLILVLKLIKHIQHI